MRKITLIILSFALVLNMQAQRIGAITIDGVQACTPVGAFNPTNNDATKPGDAQVVFPVGTDLSNVNVSINVGKDASIVEPITLPTDWTSTVEDIKVEKTDQTAWALYSITLKAIKPASLPLEIKTGAGNFNSSSWTTETVGWAGAAIDKDQNLIRFGSPNRSFVVAFEPEASYAPDSVYFTMNYLASGDPFPTDGSVTFDVDGSADGVNWTLVHQFNASNPMVTGERLSLGLSQSYRYLRWMFTKRAKSNISLENIIVTQSLPTGFKTYTTQDVKIYAAHNGSFQLTNSDLVQDIRIFDITGKLITAINHPTENLQLNNLTSGIYISEISLKNGQVLSSKIIR